MKGRIWIALAALSIGAFGVLVGCEGDAGPAGPPGTASCMGCHTDAYDMQNYIRTMQTEYAVSGHANAESVVRRGEDCARCHTTEGFQHFVETGEAVAVTESSHIGCFACHAPHTLETFAVRVTDAVAWDAGGTWDKGTSNTCATCHQIRPADPPIEEINTPITSSRWGTHHGPQSQMIQGYGAWEFDGAYPSSMHKTVANGCVGCHMAETAENGLAGGHTFGIIYEYHSAEEANSKGCSCHVTSNNWDDEIAIEEIEDRQAEFDEAMEELGNALVNLGWMSSLTSVKGSGIPANADARGAVFNYQFMREDASRGVHNPMFSDAVIEATLEYVNQQLILAGK